MVKLTEPHPIIGWESEEPIPNNYVFNDYLTSRNGRLFMEELDVAQLLVGPYQQHGFGQLLQTPLEIIYLPLIRQRVHKLQGVFQEVATELGYNGRFLYAYATKANAAEEVVRTTLAAGAHHEMSSFIDTNIAEMMIHRGLIRPETYLIANGFKMAGSHYARRLCELRESHENLIPVLEDLTEIAPFLASGLRFQVGIRQKSYGRYTTEQEMDATNSRFGMDVETLWKASNYLLAAPNLRLTLYHYMVGSQLTDPEAFAHYLKPGLEIYARLRQRHPDLHIFDFGGGLPAGLTLDFHFDYHAFARTLLKTAQEVCQRYKVPVPDMMGEFGRYTTADHGAHIFKVVGAKENNSKRPWYILDGSIMTSFPDVWALDEHFIVLPLNHHDKPFQEVQLGGITCDSDDIYPPATSKSPLYLPVETDNLYVGFFAVGAYQEMLGGVKGSKHCVLPEGCELIVDRKEDHYLFDLLYGQTSSEVLRNLGYHIP